MFSIEQVIDSMPFWGCSAQIVSIKDDKLLPIAELKSRYYCFLLYEVITTSDSL